MRNRIFGESFLARDIRTHTLVTIQKARHMRHMDSCPFESDLQVLFDCSFLVHCNEVLTNEKELWVWIWRERLRIRL